MKIAFSHIGVAGMTLLGMIIPAIEAFAQQGIANPLGEDVDTLDGILTNLIQWLLTLVGILALLALVVGGIRLIVAFGREDSVKSAKQIIFWAVIGLIVVFVSYTIIIRVAAILGAG